MSWRTFLSYGVGHVLNDMMASMWFTFALVYYQYVMLIPPKAAGMVMLVGQLTDALATAAIGVISDNVNIYCTSHYGRRKTWHMFGSILVLFSLPFAFSPPIYPEIESSGYTPFYYCFFIFFFQIGWASIENSHMALASDLTALKDERTSLLSIRYSFTVLSNILVFIVTLIVLHSNGVNKTHFGPQNQKEFQIVILVIIIIGAITTIIFHTGVHEPLVINGENRRLLRTPSQINSDRVWSLFKSMSLYQTAIIYMCSRITVNMSLVFLPVYLHSYLDLKSEKLVLLPLIMFLSSFGMSFLNRPLNVKFGRKLTYTFGVVVAIGSAVWCYFGDNGSSFKNYQIFGMIFLIGIACSVLLVTSQALTTDFIGNKTHLGALTFGLMSFTDKVSNGVVVMIVQSLFDEDKPNSNFYQTVVILNWTIPCLLAFIAIILLPSGGRFDSTVANVPATSNERFGANRTDKIREILN